MPNSPYPVYVKYADPKLSFYFLDVLVDWIPDKAGMFTIYGLAGILMSTRGETAWMELRRNPLIGSRASS